MPTRDTTAINIIADHIARLHPLTNDIEAHAILTECSLKLRHRAYELDLATEHQKEPPK